MTSTQADPATRRPQRADARRNVERLIATAREVFAERGADASLDDIAKRAGVGSGTLYRHFPTRLALVEAVYLDGVDTLCDTGDRLFETEPPAEALVDWLKAFAVYVGEKRGLAGSLMAGLDKSATVFKEAHARIETTGTALLDRAKAAGAVRQDVELFDVIRLVNAIALAGERSDEGLELSDRLLRLAIEGLRAHP